MSRFMASITTTIVTIACVSYAAPVPNLFSDQRAISVDDILTVQIVESAKAGSESKTNTGKEHSFGLASQGGTGLMKWLPKFGGAAGTKMGYDGKGATTRAGTLIATISVRVDEVLDNGNLVITGSKVVEVNEEKGIIKISGVVRPRDIQPDNMVYSSSIADAQIMYSGKGVGTTGQRPGFFTRLINWIF